MDALYRVARISPGQKEEFKAVVDKVKTRLFQKKAIARAVLSLVARRGMSLLARRRRLTVNDLKQSAWTLRGEIEAILAKHEANVTLSFAPSVVDEQFAEHLAQTDAYERDGASPTERVTAKLIMQAVFCALAVAVGVESPPGCTGFW